MFAQLQPESSYTWHMIHGFGPRERQQQQNNNKTDQQTKRKKYSGRGSSYLCIEKECERTSHVYAADVKKLTFVHVSLCDICMCAASALWSLSHWHYAHISLCMLTVWCIFFGFLLLWLAKVTVIQHNGVFEVSSIWISVTALRELKILHLSELSVPLVALRPKIHGYTMCKRTGFVKPYSMKLAMGHLLHDEARPWNHALQTPVPPWNQDLVRRVLCISGVWLLTLSLPLQPPFTWPAIWLRKVGLLNSQSEPWVDATCSLKIEHPGCAENQALANHRCSTEHTLLHAIVKYMIQLAQQNMFSYTWYNRVVWAWGFGHTTSGAVTSVAG